MEQQISELERVPDGLKDHWLFMKIVSWVSCVSCLWLSCVQVDLSGSQALDYNLNEIDSKSNNLDLQNQNRESVIFRTPTDSPLNSATTSPSRLSESSSVFSEHTLAGNGILTLNSGSSESVQTQGRHSSKMDDLIFDIHLKQRKLEDVMEDNPVEHLDETEFLFYEESMSSFEKAYDNFLVAIDSLCFKHKDELGEEEVERWQQVQSTTKAKALGYRRKMRKKAVEIGNISRPPSRPPSVTEVAATEEPSLIALKKQRYRGPSQVPNLDLSLSGRACYRLHYWA